VKDAQTHPVSPIARIVTIRFTIEVVHPHCPCSMHSYGALPAWRFDFRKDVSPVVIWCGSGKRLCDGLFGGELLELGSHELIRQAHGPATGSGR
jgi:hypothetical protein